MTAKKQRCQWCDEIRHDLHVCPECGKWVCESCGNNADTSLPGRWYCDNDIADAPLDDEDDE